MPMLKKVHATLISPAHQQRKKVKYSLPIVSYHAPFSSVFSMTSHFSFITKHAIEMFLSSSIFDMASISSSLIDQSKMLAFSLILPGLVDFGMVTKLFWIAQRRKTCALVLFSFEAILSTIGTLPSSNI